MLQNVTQLNKLKNKFRGKSLNIIMEKRKCLQSFKISFQWKLLLFTKNQFSLAPCIS